MRVLVLGGSGAQGHAIVGSLAAQHDVDEVVVGDVRPSAQLPRKARALALDALDPGAVAEAADGMAVCLTCLPGSVGLRAVENLVRAGAPTVDIAFTPQAPTHLDGAAKRSGATVVVDAGVAPGLSNVLAARAHRELGGLDALQVWVGGLPLAPPPVFWHAVYFHARDLLDEYIRPARFRQRGQDLAPHPLDAPVARLHDAEAGPMEAFVSDGLRSLLDSFPDCPDMAELTLRLPGHLDAMRALRAVGLLEGDAATDAVASALAARFPAARFPSRLLMEVWARRGGAERRYRLHTMDAGGVSAMARATGGTAAACALALARGRFREPGVHAPERLGLDAAACDAVLAELAEQGLAVEPVSRLAPR